MGARSAGNPHAACDARSGYLGQLARQSSTLPGKPFFAPSPAIRFAERAEGVKGPIAVDSSSLDDVSVLERVSFVMARGDVCRA
jgi:hypothetical protein